MFQKLIFLLMLFLAIITLEFSKLHAQEDEGEIFIISENVGKEIDLDERNKYNLFAGIEVFKSAVFIKHKDGSYLLKISYLDEKTGEEKIRRLLCNETNIQIFKKVIEKKDSRLMNNIEYKQQFQVFKAILSPNISVWMPLGGDDSEIHATSFKFGLKFMLKIANSTFIELGYSSSTLSIKDDYIKNNFKSFYTSSEEITDIKKSSGGKVNQFLVGVRLLLPSKSRTMPYFRIGLSNYDRGNIKASYSGKGWYYGRYTFDADVTIENNESGMSIYSGLGVMILIEDIAIDLQGNFNMLMLKNSRPVWFEPVFALNILL